VVAADRDGVVVVPAAMVPAVVERLAHVATLERELEAKVRDGLNGLPAIAELLASERVRWV